MKQWLAIGALGALLAVACAPGPLRQAQQRVAAGDLDGARAELERQRERNPGSVDVRVALGEVYYRLARDALDRTRDEAAYLAFLERSVDEFLTALELEPRDDRPHFYLAVMDTYRGDLRKALRGFRNAKHLKPVGTAYTNIAEILIYMGKLDQARNWNQLALGRRAPYGAVVFNEMLLEWKLGDLRRARDRFAQLRASAPEMLREINVARLPEEPRRFEDFAGYCCGSPACGPYMKNACRQLSLEVQEREISEETVRRELVIEMEQQRRLQKLYQQRKELDIEIEEAPTP